MAAIVVSGATGHQTSFEPLDVKVQTKEQPQSTQPRHVKTSLNYFKDPADGSAPHPTYVGRPETYDRPLEPLDVTINDIRGQQHLYALDKQGFEIYHHESQEKDFLDDDHIKTVYYPEIERLLKDATGATRVFIFDHTVRRTLPTPTTSTSTSASTFTSPSTPNLRGPVNRVHIDQSYPAARHRVTHHLPHLAPSLLTTRHQIINAWRPITRILRDPLAFASSPSVPDTDLVPIPLIYPDRAGETLAVRPNASHQWHYLSAQTPQEVLLIKCYDSKTDGRARRVPHSAFVDPAAEGVREPRESVEVRALVFHENESAE